MKKNFKDFDKNLMNFYYSLSLSNKVLIKSLKKSYFGLGTVELNFKTKVLIMAEVYNKQIK